jgi:hypothetical protein
VWLSKNSFSGLQFAIGERRIKNIEGELESEKAVWIALPIEEAPERPSRHRNRPSPADPYEFTQAELPNKSSDVFGGTLVAGRLIFAMAATSWALKQPLIFPSLGSTA